MLKALGWIVGILIVAIAALWWITKPIAPDAFYAWSGAIPAKPGTLLRSEAFARDVPNGAVAWRILYVTTRQRKPALASAVVMQSAAPTQSPRPVIDWTHGTTGVASGCAPSASAKPFHWIPALNDLLAKGWVYVGTDYAGLGTQGPHPFLIGPDEAHSSLDAVRAARRLKQLRLANRVVVWGHSQGGNAALWTGIEAPRYAPDVNIVGVAAVAPASDLVPLVAQVRGPVVNVFLSYILQAYGTYYPDVTAKDYVTTRAGLFTGDMATRCLLDWRTLFAVGEALLAGDTIFAHDPAKGALGKRLAENTPNGPIPAPVLIAQGSADPIILPAIQKVFVQRRCAAGQKIEYKLYNSLTHGSIVEPGSPLDDDLVRWTEERFAGKAQRDFCGMRE
ncbi:MAG TPA: lipase family protein [Rhizomicrobium sp.]